jgi:hypothetical protein
VNKLNVERRFEGGEKSDLISEELPLRLRSQILRILVNPEIVLQLSGFYSSIIRTRIADGFVCRLITSMVVWFHRPRKRTPIPSKGIGALYIYRVVPLSVCTLISESPIGRNPHSRR